MRIDEERRSMDIEARDINYILPAYVRMYLFQTRNVDPDVITFPMFSSVPHPSKKGVTIPIEYVPDTSPITAEIVGDGSDVPESTPESEATANEKEKEYEAMKARIAELESELAKVEYPVNESLDNVEEEEEPIEPPMSPARAAFAEEKKEPAKETVKESAIAGYGEPPTAERLADIKEPPGGALPPGTPADYGGRPDPRDARRIARDIAPEKNVREEEELEIGDITAISEPSKES